MYLILTILFLIIISLLWILIDINEKGIKKEQLPIGIIVYIIGICLLTVLALLK